MSNYTSLCQKNLEYIQDKLNAPNIVDLNTSFQKDLFTYLQKRKSEMRESIQYLKILRKFSSNNQISSLNLQEFKDYYQKCCLLIEPYQFYCKTNAFVKPELSDWIIADLDELYGDKKELFENLNQMVERILFYLNNIFCNLYDIFQKMTYSLCMQNSNQLISSSLYFCTQTQIDRIPEKIKELVNNGIIYDFHHNEKTFELDNNTLQKWHIFYYYLRTSIMHNQCKIKDYTTLKVHSTTNQGTQIITMDWDLDQEIIAIESLECLIDSLIYLSKLNDYNDYDNTKEFKVKDHQLSNYSHIFSNFKTVSDSLEIPIEKLDMFKNEKMPLFFTYASYLAQNNNNPDSNDISYIRDIYTKANNELNQNENLRKYGYDINLFDQIYGEMEQLRKTEIDEIQSDFIKHEIQMGENYDNWVRKCCILLGDQNFSIRANNFVNIDQIMGFILPLNQFQDCNDLFHYIILNVFSQYVYHYDLLKDMMISFFDDEKYFDQLQGEIQTYFKRILKIRNSIAHFNFSINYQDPMRKIEFNSINNPINISWIELRRETEKIRKFISTVLFDDISFILKIRHNFGGIIDFINKFSNLSTKIMPTIIKEILAKYNEEKTPNSIELLLAKQKKQADNEKFKQNILMIIGVCIIILFSIIIFLLLQQ